MSRPLAKIRKNSREELRVSLDEFHGYQLLNLRVWFEGDDGQMRPGKQGVAIRLELLPDLRAALDVAAREGGQP